MDELIVLAAARNVLTDQIFEAAQSEISNLPSSRLASLFSFYSCVDYDMEKYSTIHGIQNRDQFHHHVAGYAPSLC